MPRRDHDLVDADGDPAERVTRLARSPRRARRDVRRRQGLPATDRRLGAKLDAPHWRRIL